MTDAIEVYESADGKWRYRVKGVNGEVIAQSEAYPNAFNAHRGAQTLVRRLKDVDKNVISAVDEGATTFDVIETRAGFGAGVRPVAAVVEATGMEVVVDQDKVVITVLGPKNKESYKLVIKDENLQLLKSQLVAAENAIPTKEAYLLSIIERATTYTSEPPSVDTLVEWVNNDRGVGNNPFDKADLDSDVRAVIVDLFFARKIKTDNKKGLVILERGGR